LERLRGRIQALKVRSVSEVIRVDPVSDPVAIRLIESEGVSLPPHVRAALERRTPPGDAHGRWCIMLGDFGFQGCFDQDLLKRYYKPVLDFLHSPHGLWDDSEIPESIQLGAMTYYRAGITKAFADALLCHGYVVCVDVDPGCESFLIGVSTYRGEGTPVWLGTSFTKTQYAERFVHAHETLCRILDMAKEDGLLAGCDDTCGFYQHRDWSRSAEIVNRETTFARAMSHVLADLAASSGGMIEVLSDPASKSYNLINTKPEERAKTPPVGAPDTPPGGPG
jgi:hypothetical protein